MTRGSGILMHISSLPSKYGIGTLGTVAYEFIDFLEKSKQKYWQVLPVSPTGYGDSPYQSYSTFAGNPYLIDLELLSKNGNLNPSEYQNTFWGNSPDRVDYEALFNNRFNVLKSAFYADRNDIKNELLEFRSKEAHWIENYALFMALKDENGGLPYWEWDDSIRFCEESSINSARERLFEEIELWIYIQYRFFEQWRALKEYANSKGIKIIGDIPIYVARDSVDAWANGKILCLDKSKNPIAVAGCPPDYFTPKGQLWGNPVYDWDYLKSTNYEWWFARIKASLSLFDIVRIDHFRAFSRYYAIPFGDSDALSGKWINGPDREFFDALNQEIGDNPPIIAEDLGHIDDSARELLKYTKFPGMKVLQFAFDSDNKNEYLPHNHIKNCVAYIGNHDNEPLLSWYDGLEPHIKSYIDKYIRTNNNIREAMLKTLMSSVADTVIMTMQDILGLSHGSRMNLPGNPSGNWQWRLSSISALTDELADELAELTEIYDR